MSNAMALRMRSGMRVSALICLVLAISISLMGVEGGCGPKEYVGGKTEKVGTSGMGKALHGENVPENYNPDDTSVIEDAGSLIGGIWRGDKDFNSLLLYFISYGLYSLSFVIRGRKLKKKLGHSKDAIGIFTKLVGELMQSPDQVIRKFGKYFAKEVKSSSGSKNTDVGKIIHDSVLETRKELAGPRPPVEATEKFVNDSLTPPTG